MPHYLFNRDGVCGGSTDHPDPTQMQRAGVPFFLISLKLLLYSIILTHLDFALFPPPPPSYQLIPRHLLLTSPHHTN